METQLRPDSVRVCLEICEITSKVLDWRTSKSTSNSKSGSERALGMAEFVACKYLQFVELVAQNLVLDLPVNDAQVGAEHPTKRLQHLLFEVFKRILNFAKAQQERASESN